MQRFKNILLVLDDGQLESTSAKKSIELARLNRAKLTVIDVLPSPLLGMGLKKITEKVRAAQEKMAAERKREIIDIVGNLHNMSVTVDVLCGRPFLEIIRYVHENNCDLIIKTAERENRFQSILFGSTDLKLLRKCPCPVWIIKPEDHAVSKKILAAVDLESLWDEEELDQVNRQIMEIASSLASRDCAELLIANAYVIFEGGKLAKKLSKHFEEDSSLWVAEQKENIDLSQKRFQKLFQRYLEEKNMRDLQFSYRFVEGQAEDVIIQLAAEEEVDLVVMGTVGRTDLAGFFLGNTCEAVLSQIDCAVLAVKPPGFVSPVIAAGK